MATKFVRTCDYCGREIHSGESETHGSWWHVAHWSESLDSTEHDFCDLDCLRGWVNEDAP